MTGNGWQLTVLPWNNRCRRHFPGEAASCAASLGNHGQWHNDSATNTSADCGFRGRETQRPNPYGFSATCIALIPLRFN